MKRLSIALKNKRNAKILDIATGVGNFISLIQELTDDYSSILGIDTSVTAIERATGNFQDSRITFQVMDITEPGLYDNSFDIVCLSNSLHHLNDLPEILAEMKGLLKKDGTIIINEMYSDVEDEQQNTHVLLHHFWAEIDRMNGVCHNETYKRQEIVDILKEAYKSDSVDYWDLEQETLDGEDLSMNEEIKNQLKGTIDMSLKRIEGAADFNKLKDRGELLKKRIDDIGFKSAPQLILEVKLH
ncbi:MAG TPA: class I SAM-dependent methyltransferase, partial [Thermotogota bacterium]|nr:class I SAM-dependent methyltransferase [Thermotogota bacterium]